MPRVGRVKLLKKIKRNDKWIFAPALFDSKGRVRRDHVTLDGQDALHTEGVYFLQWWNAGTRTHEAVGADAFFAAERARRKQAELDAVRNGVMPAPVPVEPEPDRVTVATALDKYEDYIRYNRSLRTYRTYRPILAGYRAFSTRKYIDQVERQDLLDFATHYLKEGQKGKTVYNKLVVVSQMLKQYGRSKLLNASDWPSFVETVRPIYEDAELTKLFKACTPDEAMRFRFYLMSGFRDAEGRFITWRDVDFRTKAVRVTAKPQWGFQPKNWEEREVPVPEKLITLLRAYKPDKAGSDDPVFPSATGNPDGAMLEKLKDVAWRAKLNCGRDAIRHKLADGSVRTNRCATGPYCRRWFLHKFRHTYATRHLQDGIDIRTLQTWMGHRDIASTMVYLKGVRNSDIQSRLNQGSIAAFG
jgi:integrase/recombinase XerD